MANQPKTPKSADEQATEIVESIKRQMRGAATAAKRSANLLEKAGVTPEQREAVIKRLAPFWADVQAGLKGVRTSNGGSETPLLSQVKSGK